MGEWVIIKAIEKIDGLIGIEYKLLKKELRLNDQFVDAEITLKYNKTKFNYYVSETIEMKRKMLVNLRSGFTGRALE